MLGATGKPNAERQRIQKTLFHEKQTIIENCLFGVDINPNSVKICRLRLWIELLKNAYYTDESGFTELETLPNIDINIKQGNSLLSKFSLTEDLSDVFKKQKFSLRMYKDAVTAYKDAKTKDAKAELQRFIDEIKGQFHETVYNRDPRRKKIATLRGQRVLLDNNIDVFGNPIKDPKLVEIEKKRLDKYIEQIETEISDIENNALYRGSFEWRFEFPEVLNDKGDFIGFDAIIGNPPYDVLEKERNTPLEPHAKILEYAKTTDRYTPVLGGKLNLYRLFIKLSYDITANKSRFAFIIPLTFAGDNSVASTRKFFMNHYSNIIFHCFPQKDNPNRRVFVDAKQSTLVLLAKLNKDLFESTHTVVNTYPANSFEDNKKIYKLQLNDLEKIDFENVPIPLVDTTEWDLLLKIHKDAPTFFDCKDEVRVNRGEINQTILREYINRDSKMANLLKGVEIGQYCIKTKLSQGFKEYFDEERYLRKHSPILLKSVRRIATQRITGVDERLRLVATVVEAGSYFADSTNSIYIKPTSSITNEYILALLNSKLFQWRFKKTSTNNNVGTNEINALPLKRSSGQKQIELIVNQILTAKAADPTADTSALEAEIDRLVYELYGLTDEEIAIVKG